ncbi:MAG: tRNA uridine-5-carboxymethylaminomethyl(34) synthesis GTPase MnmE [Calditrichia bacterium]
MNFLNNEQTIVALSSPVGKGAIAVVRFSGTDCLSIVNQIFTPAILETKPRQAIYGEIHHPTTGELVDRVICIFYKKPHSYTGEDLVEIFCHCNPLIIEKIIDEGINMGARMARPGEFTERAFFNNKLDLSQAEAVVKVIEAKTNQSLQQSLRQLEGGLSGKIQAVRNDVLELASFIEISLDFNEDDAQIYEPETLREKAELVVDELDLLISSYHYGALLQQGAKMVLAGKPNVGKSSLLNLFLRKERAIVSHIPGTTRDYLTEEIEVEGIPVQAVDTAGVRETLDPVEEAGVYRTLEQAGSARIILALFEAHSPLDADDQRLIKQLKEMPEQTSVVVVLNKIDLGLETSTKLTLRKLGYPVVEISATKKRELSELKQCIKNELLKETEGDPEEILISSLRQRSALEKARDSLTQFISGLTNKFDEVILAAELRSCLDYLGEVTGETTPEHILNQIFSSFCIGK